MKKHPEKKLKKIFTFIGVDNSITISQRITLNTREPLINYAIPLAYSLIHNQGGTLKACLGLEKSDNAEYESDCKPRRARPEAHIYGIVLLAKDRAIRCKARFVAARFRSRRGMA